MDPTTQKAKEIFLTLVGKVPVDQWDDHMDRACAGDEDLRQQVLELLDAHRQEDSFLEEPASGIAPTIDTGPAPEQPGTQIGRYKLVHEMGQGGMGMVYMAVQKEPVKRKVALKVIKPGMDTREVVARFEAERQALALMDHPSIATVHDGGTTDSGRPYFVMELVVGTPITEYCDECRYTTRQRLELFTQVCNAVQHAHQKGVIHRDIKPSNILVTMHDAKPVPKVIDFGIAKAIHQPLTDQSLHTHAAQMIGTPLYMSPEQAHRTGQDVDTRTDVFSLGVLLYELLTGTTPFDKERLQTSGLDEFKRIIREEEPPRPSTRLSTVDAALETVADKHSTDLRSLSQELSGELDWIVMKALEKDRSRRYESASDFAKDIQRHLDDEPVEACPPSTVYRLGKFYRRNKTALATASIVALALVLGLAGTTWQSLRATRESMRASEESIRATQESTRATQALHGEQQQRERAEANFQKAMGAVDEMLTQVADEVADIPRMVPVRRALLERALTFYLGFLEEKSEDSEVQREAARAQKRAGDILTLLGEHERAEKHYREAISRFEATPVEEAQVPGGHHDLAKSLIALAGLLRGMERHEEAREACNRAISIERRLVAKSPKEVEYRSALAAALNTCGGSLNRTGRSEDAVKAYQEAAEIMKQLAADFPEVPLYRFNLAGYQITLGSLLGKTGRNDKSEASYQAALEIRKQLAADFPHVPEYRCGLAASHNTLGLRLRSTGRDDEAEASYQAALEIRKQLEADFPRVPRYRSDLAASHNNLGLLLRSTGRDDEAEASYREAVEIMKQLAAVFPQVPGHCSDLNCYYNNLCNIFRDTGRFEEAETSQREAVETWKQLAARFSEVPAFRANLAGAYNNLGILMHKTGRQEEAEAPHREALEVVKQLAADFPGMPEYRYQLATFQSNLGNLLTNTGRNDDRQLDTVVALYLKALDVYEQLVTQYPTVRAYQNGLGSSYGRLTNAIRTAGGQRDEAMTLLEEAIQSREDLVAESPSVRVYEESLAVLCTNLADLRGAAGERDTAVALYQKAIQIQQELVAGDTSFRRYVLSLGGSYHHLGRLLRAQDRYADTKDLSAAALEFWSQTLGQEHPVTLDRCDRLASFLATCPDPDVRDPIEAVALAIKAVERVPEKAAYWSTLGIAHQQAENYNEAEKAWSEALELAQNGVRLQPQSLTRWETWNGICLDFYRTRNWEGAEEEARLGIQLGADLGPRRAHALFNVAPLLFLAGERGEYRQFCLALLDEFEETSSPSTASHVARLCAMDPSTMGVSDKVVQLAQRAVTGDLYWHLYTLGRAYSRAGNFEQAMQWLDKSLSCVPPDNPIARAIVLLDLAIANHSLGHAVEAQDRLTEATHLLDRYGHRAAGWPHEWIEQTVLRREAESLIRRLPKSQR